MMMMMMMMFVYCDGGLRKSGQTFVKHLVLLARSSRETDLVPISWRVSNFRPMTRETGRVCLV